MMVSRKALDFSGRWAGKGSWSGSFYFVLELRIDGVKNNLGTVFMCVFVGGVNAVTLHGKWHQSLHGIWHPKAGPD